MQTMSDASKEMDENLPKQLALFGWTHGFGFYRLHINSIPGRLVSSVLHEGASDFATNTRPASRTSVQLYCLGKHKGRVARYRKVASDARFEVCLLTRRPISV